MGAALEVFALGFIAFVIVLAWSLARIASWAESIEFVGEDSVAAQGDDVCSDSDGGRRSA